MLLFVFQVLLQLSQWLPETRSDARYPNIANLADESLSLLHTTLQASASSIKPHSITSHLIPLLNNSLYTLAHMWNVEGRVSRKHRQENCKPLLKKCLEIMAAVAAGGQAGRKVDAQDALQRRKIWGVLDHSVGPPTVAVDVLCAVHVLVEDEHLLTKATGGLRVKVVGVVVTIVDLCLSQSGKLRVRGYVGFEIWRSLINVVRF